MELERNQSRFGRFPCPSGPTSTVKFDGETIRQMGIAFEMALASLGATPGCDDPIRAALAQEIIAQAQAGECDPERLCDAALKAVRPPDPLPGSPPPVELPVGAQAAEG